jgi:phosphatidylinositol mannoside-binding LppM-like protein
MRGRLLVLIAALVLVATGCRLDVDVHVAMEPNGSGTITVTAVADAELVAQAPGLAADLRLDDLATAGWAVEAPAATPDGGLRVVLTHPFASPAEATALLATLNASGGPFQGVALTREVDGKTVDYAATGSLQLVGGIDAFADEQVRALGAGTPFATTLNAQGLALRDALGITLQVQLPVEATSTNGTREGDAVRWEVPLDGAAMRVDAIASHSPSTGAKRLLAMLALGVLVAWIAFAAAFLTYVVRQRRRRPVRRV